MISDTRQKFLEAEFFLNKLKNQDEINKEATGEYSPFAYYVSAFLAAFRNITFVMQKEFNKEKGFEEWYKTQREVLSKDKILLVIMEQRVNITHHEMLKPEAVVQIGVVDLEGKDIDVKDVWLSFKGTPDYSIIDQCVYALGVIKPLVEECEKMFYKDRNRPTIKTEFKYKYGE